MSLWGCLYPFLYIQGGRGYKEGNRVSYNMIPIRTPSLLTYVTNIFCRYKYLHLGEHDIWSSRFFWMVGRVIADPSLGLPNLYGVVPRVPILVSRHWRFSTEKEAATKELGGQHSSSATDPNISFKQGKP
jgi:hypothetical protein